MAENHHGAEAGARQGMGIFEILHVVLYRKFLIVSICAATALLSCIYSLTLPNIYAATAKVLPPQKESSGLSSMLGQMGGIAGMAAGAAKGNENELYVSLLKSRTVGAAVIRRLDLARVYGTKSFNRTWQRLDGAIKVQSGRDGIIAITAEDTDPKQAALLANTFSDELGRILVRLNLSKVGSERLFLEKRLELVKKDLQAAEEDVKSFARRNGIVHVESQANATVAGVVRIKNELASKEVQLATLRTYQSDENFEVKELQAAIRRLRQDLAGMTGNGGGDGIPALGNVPGLGLEYSRKMRELKTQEALFEELTKQYEVAKLNEAKDSSSLQVLDEAVPPEEKSRPKRSTIVGMATVAAFTASVILTFVLNHLEKMPEEDRAALAELKKAALKV